MTTKKRFVDSQT